LLLSVKFNAAISPVVVAGLKVTITLQLLPAVTGFAVEQAEEEIAKSPAFGPLIDGLAENTSEALPVFIKVTVMGALVTPCGSAPKARLSGKDTTGAVPVPVSVTVWLLVRALLLSAKLRMALSAAAVEGVNVTVTVQLLPAATGLAVEQVEAVIAKSAILVPDTEGLLLNVSGPVPVFMTVSIIGALVEPSATEPNASGMGDRFITGTVPVPLSVTANGFVALLFLVSARANFIASSFASPPPVVKKTRPPSDHGAISTIARASAAR
jgi:hypothetical protein